VGRAGCGREKIRVINVKNEEIIESADLYVQGRLRRFREVKAIMYVWGQKRQTVCCIAVRKRPSWGIYEEGGAIVLKTLKKDIRIKDLFYKNCLC